MTQIRILALAVLMGWASVGGAQTAVPDCMARGVVLPVNNQQVSEWKKTTRDEYKNRGHIQGTITDFFKDATGHHHVEVTMTSTPPDTIEIVYNEKFGAFPATTAVGSKVEACGDYITAQHASGGYPPSPDGAILHWVHRADHRGHDSGYVVVDGVVCGQE